MTIVYSPSKSAELELLSATLLQGLSRGKVSLSWYWYLVLKQMRIVILHDQVEDGDNDDDDDQDLPCFELEELWYIVDAREKTYWEDVVTAGPGVGHLGLHI